MRDQKLKFALIVICAFVLGAVAGYVANDYLHIDCNSPFVGGGGKFGGKGATGTW